MSRPLIAFLFVAFSQNIFAASFSERISLADKAEDRAPVYEYLYKEMYPAIGSNLAAIMNVCVAKASASRKDFTIVADISNEGAFTKVAFKPKTNTAVCFVAGMVATRPPPPSKCNCGPLPIVIHMSVKP